MLVASAIRDITERKRTEERLRNSELTIVEAYRKLRMLQKKLIEQEKLAALGELATVVAHEVRNPLSGIKGGLEVMLKQLQPNDQKRRTCKQLLGLTQRLDRTVQDLLLFAKGWNPSPLEFRFETLIDRVISFASESCASKDICFEKQCNGDTNAVADFSQMELVLNNIISNSLQAMPKGGTVSIKCIGNNSHLQLEIKDTGHGILPEEQSKLFQPFFTTKTKGTGLGLAICKKIIEAHSGTITIDSSGGTGTVVRISLPREFKPARGIPEKYSLKVSE
jgi:signal transduction histidine kinase